MAINKDPEASIAEFADLVVAGDLFAILSPLIEAIQSEGSSWIVWTYAADRILARATRSGDTAADWRGLYEWWSQIRLFVVN